MNYHLNQQGQTVGVFPLEELRRRRQSEELTGTELVWCEGMPQWQALDAVLQQEPSRPPAPPLLIAKPKSNQFLVLGIVVGALLLAAALLVGGIVIWKIVRFRYLVRQFAVTSESPVRESALAAASRPVLWSTNALTIPKVRERAGEFRVRQYVDAYDKYSEHSPAYDTEAREMLKSWMEFNYGTGVRTNRAALVEMCDKLEANVACNDPVVLTLAAGETDEMQEAVRRFERAIKAFEHSRHKAYPRFYPTVMLAEKLIGLRREHDRVRKIDSDARQLWKASFRDGSFRPEDQPELAEILIDSWGAGFLSRNGPAIVLTVKTAGKPYEWLALVLEGRYQINEAWKARGNGYANTVTPEGWKGFREHLALARKSLTKAWQLRPDLAEAPYQLITVSLGDSGIGEMRRWFDRTVAAQMDHVGAWNALRWGLRPRWNGDLDSMLAFGVMAANSRRYDTDVPCNLFRSISDVESELKLPLGEHIYGREDIWPHLQQMYEGYIAEPSQANTRDGWRTTYSAVAFLAGKYDVARTQLEAIHWQPWPQNLQNWGRDLSLMPLEVAARTSPVGQEIDAAESRYKMGSLGVALRLYTELNAAANLDERARSYVQDRLATIEMEQRFQAGEWVDFLPSGENLAGWMVQCGKFKHLADGALEVQADQSGHVLFSRARVGSDFEVKGAFEVARSSTDAFQAGLVMGTPSTAWCSFRMKRNVDEGDVASFADGWTVRQITKPVTLNKGTNTFSFRLQHGLVSATVNDTEVFKNAQPPKYASLPTSESHLGLGAYNDTNDTVIRYRNVQVHKLSSR